MGFKNLEERYNATVKDLYSGATLKFDGGKPSNGRSDDPLIVRRPGDGYIGSVEKISGRMIPASSTIQDVKRLTLFTLSVRGVSFLAKQQLLQTGNVFEFTRTLNPAFVVGNAVPFLHIKRNLRPLNELIGKTDTSYSNVRKLGQLQKNTYDNLSSKNIEELPGASGFGKALKDKLLGPLRALNNTVKDAVSAFSPFQKRNIGELKGGKWTPESWKYSRPELKTYIPSIQSKLYEKQQASANERSVETITPNRSQRSTLSLSNVFNLNTRPQFSPSSFGQNAQLGATTSTGTVSFIKYFDSADSIASSPAPVGSVPSSVIAKRGGEGSLKVPSGKKISYIRDPANNTITPQTGRTTNTTQKSKDPLEIYNTLNKKFSDAVFVSIAMGDSDPVQFRAFITDVSQTATPEYKSYQYIGRIEKFVSYVGVQREVSFKLGVIAFSKDELKQVWNRINYLTGTVYPYNVYKGILQPNIIKLTIGDLYRDQPGYISGLSTNFNQLAESWEIDSGNQVPISAQMDMKFVLIEKKTKTAGSPFYAITGDN